MKLVSASMEELLRDARVQESVVVMILLPTTGGLGLGNRWVFKPCLRFGLETESREWRVKGKEGEEKAWEGTLMEKGTAGPRPEALGVQWLRPHTPDAGALVRSLVRELDPTGRT